MSHHIAVEPPSYRERSYGLGWVRTQLPGIGGVTGDNPDYFDLPELPELHTGTGSSLLIYHQGSTIGYYSCILLFPETQSAVVVLTNTAALTDAADWISQAVTQALYNNTNTTDCVQWAVTTRDRHLSLFTKLANQIAAGRRPDAKSRPLHQLTGRYRNKKGNFFIDIARDPESDTCLLYTSPSPRDGLLSRMPSSA